MCFHSQQSKTAQELKNRFKAKFSQEKEYIGGIYNGFQFPKTPIITNESPDEIQLFQWGLLPSWTNDIHFRKNTLNARLETLTEKVSFKNILNQRCLILADGFYEWKWLDEKGKNKEKYFISLPNQELYAYAGLYYIWENKETNEIIPSYTIITTQANTLMAEIHNTKKRMPLIIQQDQEINWLLNGKISMDNHLLKAKSNINQPIIS